MLQARVLHGPRAAPGAFCSAVLHPGCRCYRITSVLASGSWKMVSFALGAGPGLQPVALHTTAEVLPRADFSSRRWRRWLVARTRKADRADVRGIPREPEVEVWDDPDWGPALGALEGCSGRTYTGESDPKPLAKLLCSGKPVPEQVAWRLGVLLDPPFLREMIDLKKKIEMALKPNIKLEAAIAEVMKESGKSRSYVMKAWTFTVKKGIPLLAKYSPQQSSREAGES